MSAAEDLLQLEREGWEALSTSAEAAGRFYADNLAADVLMLLPGGMVLDDREEVIESDARATVDSVQAFRRAGPRARRGFSGCRLPGDR